MNFTEPSAKQTFTPPGWLLVGGADPSGVTEINPREAATGPRRCYCMPGRSEVRRADSR